MEFIRRLIDLFRKNKKTLPKGFTLIELVVVIGILAILLAIVLIAINPGRQFKQANDTKRRSDVNALLNAIHQYAADNKGDLPSGITVAPAKNISNTGADICAAISPTYISALPVDPSTKKDAITDCAAVGGYDTVYQVVKDANGRVTVSASETEIATPDISVTR